MKSEAFLPFFREAFATTAAQMGLVEFASTNFAVLKEIFYKGHGIVVKVSLDVRDGYLESAYGGEELYRPDGSMAPPSIASFAAQRSIDAQLRAEGVTWPDREGGLFVPGRLEEAVRELVAGIQRHSGEILALGKDAL